MLQTEILFLLFMFCDASGRDPVFAGYVLWCFKWEFVGWLLNVRATCECISGTDLLRQFYVLPH